MSQRDDTRPRPGALAATVLFHSNPDQPASMVLRHEPGCASRRGGPCDCLAELVRKPRAEELKP